MSHSSSSVHRSSSPSISSSSVSTQNDEGSIGSESSEELTPAGSFNAGIIQIPINRAEPEPTIAQPQDPSGADAVENAPPCPRPVLLLIRGLAIAIGTTGLVGAIYGGMKLMPIVDPALDTERGKHAGIMVSGLVALAVSLVAGMATRDDDHPAPPAAHPA